jgi:glycosyltransferase involved in cell wall biosynthesis
MTGVSGRVSVVVPFFNPNESFLRETVASVISQTYSEWEMILVDDGSQDCRALDFAHALAADTRDRIRVVTYERPGNRGASAARNEGLRYARGEYVAFLDADDCWLPDKLKVEIAALESFPAAGMVYSSYLYWYSWTGSPADQRRDWIPELGVESDRLLPPPRFVLLCLQGSGAVPTPSCAVFRKDAVEAVGGFDASFPGLYDDQVLFSKVGLRYPVVPLARLTTYYRQHGDSICARTDRDAEREARGRFLTWLSQDLAEVPVIDRHVATVLKAESWKHGHPWLARARRWLGKLSNGGANASREARMRSNSLSTPQPDKRRFWSGT